MHFLADELKCTRIVRDGRISFVRKACGVSDAHSLERSSVVETTVPLSTTLTVSTTLCAATPEPLSCADLRVAEMSGGVTSGRAES